MPVSTGNRRWVSVAAAAGLIIGLVAGQLLHFVPSDSAARREALTLQPSPVRQNGPGLIPVTATTASPLTDDRIPRRNRGRAAIAESALAARAR